MEAPRLRSFLAINLPIRKKNASGLKTRERTSGRRNLRKGQKRGRRDSNPQPPDRQSETLDMPKSPIFPCFDSISVSEWYCNELQPLLADFTKWRFFRSLRSGRGTNCGTFRNADDGGIQGVAGGLFGGESASWKPLLPVVMTTGSHRFLPMIQVAHRLPLISPAQRSL